MSVCLSVGRSLSVCKYAWYVSSTFESVSCYYHQVLCLVFVPTAGSTITVSASFLHLRENIIISTACKSFFLRSSVIETPTLSSVGLLVVSFSQLQPYFIGFCRAEVSSLYVEDRPCSLCLCCSTFFG